MAKPTIVAMTGTIAVCAFYAFSATNGAVSIAAGSRKLSSCIADSISAQLRAIACSTNCGAASLMANGTCTLTTSFRLKNGQTCVWTSTI